MKYDQWVERLEDFINNGYNCQIRQDQLKIALLEKEGEYYKMDEEGILMKVSEDVVKKIKGEEAKKTQETQKDLTEPQKEWTSKWPPIPLKGPIEGPLKGRVSILSATEQEEKPVKKEEIFHVEEFTGIPREFLIMIGEAGKEQIYVKRAGLLYKAEKKGFRAIQIELQPLPDEKGFLAKATLYPKISKEEIEVIKAAQNLDPEVQRELLKHLFVPFVDYATATPQNVKMSTMLPYLRELASTRASNRVLRSFVACGFTSIEETPEYKEE